MGDFLPNRGSNSGEQISSPVLYWLSYSILGVREYEVQDLS